MPNLKTFQPKSFFLILLLIAGVGAVTVLPLTKPWRVVSASLGLTPTTKLSPAPAPAPVFATFTVTNTNDSGAGSLRQAILNANASPGIDTIDFNLGAGTPTINLLSSLPIITDPIVIDGNTGGSTRVELNGVGAGGGSRGIHITAGNSTVAGLVINNFNQFGTGQGGIVLQTNGGNTVRNCYIGINAAGTASLGNSQYGIHINNSANNTIGGTSPAERNVISNPGAVVAITGVTSTGNKIIGNYIGTNASGTAALSGGGSGVYMLDAPNNIVGGTTAGERNIISGNNNGVFIGGTSATGNKIIGNYIGTNPTGTAAIPNSIGVFTGGPNTIIGGPTAGERNIISGNQIGVYLYNGNTTGCKVMGNYIGTDVTGTVAVGNAVLGVYLYVAANNVIGGTTAGERNIISGNGGGIGTASLTPTTNNVVRGNYIGTDVNGTADLGNTGNGVDIGSPGNTIGGTTPGERNIISGNNHYGVAFTNTLATGNKVIGNYIGTDVTGMLDLGNSNAGGNAGVFMNSNNNTIGGTTAGERNIISGNDHYGIHIQAPATGNKVLGNYIGTAVNGITNLGNTSNGVYVNSGNNTIGGTAAGERNVIAFNGENGVQVLNGTGAIIRGNAIYNNTKLGIDLVSTPTSGVVTPNDATDSDSGPNNLQNFPVLNPITLPCTITGTIPGGVGVTNGPVSPVTLDFYANASCDASSNGEGDVYLGSMSVTLTSTATPFSFSFTPVPGKQVITATATDNNGNTSEFSSCQTAPINQPPVVTPVSLTRQAGVAGITSTIATVSDANQAANTLSILINGSSSASVNGVTVSGLSVDASGNLTALVAAACGATNASFILRASDGCQSSTEATLTVMVDPNLPAVVTQPQNQTACVGAPVSLTAAITGAGLSYQWRKGGVAIAGATASSFLLAAVTAADAGSYDVMVQGSCGTVTSQAASLTVNDATAISTQPVNQTVCEGAATSFSVAASGTDLSYQWRKNGSAIPGATSSTFNLASAAASNAGSYDVMVTGSCGVLTSSAAMLTVNQPTAINTPPSSQTVCVGSPVSFSVAATGTALTYQWRKDGVNIPGATASTYTLAAAIATDAGNYDVTVTGACSTLTAMAATLTVNAATTVTTQPLSQTRSVGQSVSFSVAANGTSLSYQWRKNGTNIAGATGSAFTIATIVAGDVGSYDVVVSGACGSVTSAVATLSLSCTSLALGPATLPGGTFGTAYPPTTITATGGSGSLTFALTGTLPTGMNFSGGTLTGTPTQGGSFPLTITATDANGCTGSRNYTFVVNRLPVALCQNVTVTADATCTATADINNGSSDPDGDALTITQSPAGPYAVGTHTVTLRVDDGRGGVSTCTATVTVNAPKPEPTITAPVSGAIFAVGMPVNLTGTFTDLLGTTHTATWQFASGTATLTQAGVVTEPAGTTPGAVTATRTFTAAGVYQVTLTAANNCGGTGSTTTVGTDQFSALLVIYDPAAGFVTGGGWINSPAGAYVPNPTLTGKANFGFVSKYQNGANVPTGNTEFQFKAGNLNFKSTSYEWLVVAGAKAQYKGYGTINNAGNYRFMLTVIDGEQPGGGGADKFRIRIWSDGGGLVYDNQLNVQDSDDPTTLLGGGQITIHKK